MDIKEKGRYVFIREKAKTIKQKPREKQNPVTQQTQVVNALRDKFVSEKRSEEQERTATEQVEQLAQSAASYYGEKTFFTVKNISAPADIKEKPRGEIPIKGRTDLHTDIKDKSSTVKPRENKAKLRTRHSAEAEQKANIKERQIRQAKNRLAADTGKKTVARQDRLSRLKKAIAHSVKHSSETWIMAAEALLIALIPMLMIFGVVAMMFDGGEQNIGTEPLSEEVLEYSPYIFAYACEHGLEEYTGLIKALMMQESAGRGTDPMQASECSYNTKYPNTPGGITDPEYSINVGIQYFKDCLELANVQSPEDIEGISLALQGYNFGSGYIPWALQNYGGHSELSALEFSEMMAQQNGWESYGDPYYVSHVLRYYSIVLTEAAQ